MGDEHDAVRVRLGRVGVWTFASDALRAPDVRDVVGAIEALWAADSLGLPNDANEA